MAETDHLDDRTFGLLFAIKRSVRYHLHRRRFFESWNAFTVIVAVVGGSASVTAFIGDWWPWLSPGVAALVAIVAAIDLAVGTGRCGNAHGDLARQFISLEKQIAEGETWTIRPSRS